MKGHTNRLVRSAAVTAATVLLASSVSSAQLAHRYSFTGGSLADSVGALNLGNAGGVTFNADRAVFPGTGNSGTTNGFLTVGAGVVPSTDVSATVEAWGAYDSNVAAWSRIYDFGAGTNDNFAFTAKSGNNDTRAILKRNNVEQTATFGGLPLISVGATIEHQSVQVFDTTANTTYLYVDGFLFASNTAVTIDLNGFPQTSNFIGKSQYAGDADLLGNIDELRTYNGALGAADVLASYGAGPNALATSTLFNFTATNGDLATGSSYAGAAAPGLLDRATIANGGTATVTGTENVNQVRLTNGTVTIGSGATLNDAGGFDLNSAAGNTTTVNINGGTLNTVGFLATTATGTHQLNINNGTLNLTIGANAVVGGGSTVALTGTNTISVNNAQNVAGYSPIATMNGVFSGAGGFNKTGIGVLQLTGASTFDGAVDIQAGQVLLGNATALGSAVGGTTVDAGASVRNNGFRTIAENFNLNGGQFQIGGATQTGLSGNITLSADYNDIATPAFIADGGSNYNITGNVTSSGGDRNLVLGASSTASIIRGQLNLNNGTLIVTGGGTWALANDTNSFGIAGIVAGNTLRVGAGTVPDGMLAGATVAGSLSGALPAAAVISITDPTSTIEFSRSDSITVPNYITGSGIVRKTNVGVLNLTGANDFSGGLVVDSGTVLVTNLASAFGNSPNSANLVNAQGAVAVPAGTSIVASGVLGKINNISTGAIALTENSAEALDFSSTNLIGLHLGAVIGGDYTYSGAITPNASTFRFGGGGGNLTVATNLVQATGSTVEIAGQGTVRLAGANTYTGATNVVNGGTIVLNGQEELDASSGLSVIGGTIQFVPSASGQTDLSTAGKTLNLNNAQINTNGNTITLANSFTSGGYISKIGTGTLVLGNAATTVQSIADLFVRRGTVTLANKQVLTTTGYSSVGQLLGDNGTLNVQDTAALTVNGDFNIADNPSVAVLNQTGGTVTANTLYVGKIGFVDGVNAGQASNGTYNMSAGTLNTGSGGGDWRIGGGNGAGDINATGVFNLSGTAVVNSGHNFQPGAFGKGTLNITGGTWNQTGSFVSIGRFPTAVGVWNQSAGTYNYTAVNGNQLIVGEQGNGTLNLSGATTGAGASTMNVRSLQIANAATAIGLINQTGGVINVLQGPSLASTGTAGPTPVTGLQGGAVGGQSTYNLSGGILNLNGTDVLATLQHFNFTGGELRNPGTVNIPITQTGAGSLLSLTSAVVAPAGSTLATPTIVGGYSLTAGTASLGAGKTLSVTGPVTLSGNGTIAGPGTITSTGTTAAYNLNNGTISANVGGAGAVNVTKDTIATVTLVGPGAYAPIATDGAGVTDLKNGKLVLDYTGNTDPTAVIAARLSSGHASNFAAGSGKIISSTAGPSRGIGYVDDTTNSKLSIAATLYGDTNLDLAVNFTDLLALAKSYNQTGTNWANGDFDYSGKTDFSDLLALAKNYNGAITAPVGALDGTSAQFQADFALAQSLAPEPTMLCGLIAGGLTLMGRRRKA